MVAAAAAGGEVKINNVIPRHLESISAKLREMGVTVIAGEDSVTVKSSGRLRKVNIKTMPYPGFPTDMQPQFAAALCLAGGMSTITEGIYDNRFKYLTELRKMGAQAVSYTHLDVYKRQESGITDIIIIPDSNLQSSTQIIYIRYQRPYHPKTEVFQG